VLVVHRGNRSDVSLPKGKLDPGETLPQTAVREIAEETGLSIALGAPLGTVEYSLPSGREKIVHYWAAEIDHHALELAKFTPNNEIAALEWLSLEKAKRKLSYSHDVEVLERFEKRLKKGNARTFAIIVVRHGKAVPPESWDGPDSTRPLLQRGADQSVAIAKGIAAFAPEKILSSNAARCLATVEPLARLTQLEVKATASISQDAYENGTGSVATVVAKRIKRKRTAVLCSHGPVIPEILDALLAITSAQPTSELRQAAMMSTGEFAIIHVSCEHPRQGVVATEMHSPNLS
jgi:8-oxo-dGTP diphosphatase